MGRGREPVRIAEVTLPDGRRLEALDDGSRLVVRGPTTSSLPVQLPTAGIGGGRFVLSPSGRTVVLSLYSGQSEEGYVLLRLEGDRLEPTGRQRYVRGEGADFAFDAAEARLAMLLPFDCCFDLLDEEQWELEPPAVVQDRRLYPFGELRLHELATGAIAVYPIDLSVRPGAEPASRDGFSERLAPAFTGPRAVSFTLPWGARTTLSIPPTPAPIVVRVDG